MSLINHKYHVVNLGNGCGRVWRAGTYARISQFTASLQACQIAADALNRWFESRPGVTPTTPSPKRSFQVVNGALIAPSEG